MKELPKISDSEWEIMKIIWQNDSITSTKIINELQEKTNWKSSTIKTLINRLLNKEAISFTKKGKEYYYFSIVSEEECIKKESKSFLSKVFNGSLNSMVVNFVKSQKLTKTEIDELKSILDNYQSKDEK
ncbi:MAG: BlaI/MecI/CopY family transcriptional regulator [Clostridium sp.]|uniref:BlaI/MecI/CopY family transcriptional regulator n=1 Tax=Paraclostridium bifermentans TaxID=1490 RepID=UPI00189DC604|nr:BlaI/MecI/CopY family transcriptional regulator [Paraclostridium bifermentans]MBQ8997396.1 BlaI/MecI/CopY family transcriptional regulator [Clostridium sp.]